MLGRSLYTALLFALALVVAPVMSAEASKDKGTNKLQREKKTQKYECHLISRAEAIKQAKRKVNGKVVGVQLSDRGSRSVYKVRMLVDQKRVKTVSINACR